MFYVTPEGEDLRTGFNFYPSDDPHSKGFRFKLWRFIFWSRFSTMHQKWHIYGRWITPTGF